jgi:hypothetical protein
MMYLLLRDNKQSGPYSLDELKEKGLKAYDLVWVDGRSAAWRYPSEIEELKAFAPVVEEQPFDRFFKKPTATRTVSVNESTISSLPKAQSANTDNFATRKRNIYVTMPGGGAPGFFREPAREPVRDTLREAPREREPAREIVREIVFEPVRVPEPVKLMPQRNPRGILKPVLFGFGILVLLTAGIVIGLFIDKETPIGQKLASGTGSTSNAQPIVHSTSQQLPVPPVVTSSLNTNPVQMGAQQGANHTDPSAIDTKGQIDTKNPAASLSTGLPGAKPPRITTPKQKATAPKSLAVLPLVTSPDSTSGGMPVVHRETVRRTDPAENQSTTDLDKDAVKANLANQVSVGTNKYGVGTFGGISDLQVTVTNRSVYPLDLVVVEVQYIQANKKTFKTENLYFHSIGPGSALMQEAPKSPRGIKIQYKITLINSKELGLSESGVSPQ